MIEFIIVLLYIKLSWLFVLEEIILYDWDVILYIIKSVKEKSLSIFKKYVNVEGKKVFIEFYVLNLEIIL